METKQKYNIISLYNIKSNKLISYVKIYLIHIANLTLINIIHININNINV